MGLSTRSIKYKECVELNDINLQTSPSTGCVHTLLTVSFQSLSIDAT